MIYDALLKRSSVLEHQIFRITDQLNHCPQGKLISCCNRNSHKWYIRRDSQTAYLPRSERLLAEQLAKRRYLQLKLEEYTLEKKHIDKYLRFLEKEHLSERYMSDARYHDLLAPHFQPSDSYAAHWQSESFSGNPSHPEDLIHETPFNYKVRSKSEQLISLALFERKIPHRYEYPLTLHSTTFYPDFTLMHPDTHQIYYYEHFGMMDDPAYAAEAGRKLQKYISNGIIPSINLIITSETRAHPLNPSTIDQVLDLYF